jgi:Spherulation-specific family 4
MRKSRGISCYISVLILMVVAGIIGSPAPVTAGGIGVLVPAYFYPGTGGPGGSGDGWAAMANAASTIPVTAIFNPNSGPLPGPPDSNYVNAMTGLESQGGTVVAYIPSGFGSTLLGNPTTPGTIEYDVNTYITQYGSLIKGFFIDQVNLQMNSTTNTLPYYQSIYNYIKSQGSYTVIGNPGSPFLNGVTPQGFLSTANIMNVFEGPNLAPSPGAPGFNAYPYGLNSFESYPSNRFSNIVYDVPANAGNLNESSAMLADLSKAVQLNAGYVYITNLSGGNPYSALPSYWDQEVSAIASVPEPGSLTIMASGCLLATLCIAARRRSHTRRQPG